MEHEINIKTEREALELLLAIVPELPNVEDEYAGVIIHKLFELRNHVKRMLRIERLMSVTDPRVEHLIHVTNIAELLRGLGWLRHGDALDATDRDPVGSKPVMENVLWRLCRMIAHPKCAGMHKRRAILIAQYLRLRIEIAVITDADSSEEPYELADSPPAQR